MDQVIADPGGQFPAPGPVRSHQQDVPPGQVAGHVGMDGLVHGLLRRGAADPAVLVVLVQRRGIPAPQPQRGLAFPSGFEPDRLGQLHVPEPVRQQHHRAAAFHGGELLLIPSGIGYQMLLFQGMFQDAKLFAVIVVLLIEAVFIGTLMRRLERRLQRA